MRQGDILLASLPQADGTLKIRPVLCLASMPPFQDLLVRGVSTQLHQAVPDFDEILAPSDEVFLQVVSKPLQSFAWVFSPYYHAPNSRGGSDRFQERVLIGSETSSRNS